MAENIHRQPPRQQEYSRPNAKRKVMPWTGVGREQGPPLPPWRLNATTPPTRRMSGLNLRAVMSTLSARRH